MIFLLIAGTYTPVDLLVLEGTLATVVLAVVWGGALAGIGLELAWTQASRWLGGTVYPRGLPPAGDRRGCRPLPGFSLYALPTG